MVENYIYFTVKLAACGYMLYRVWIILFNRQLFGLWSQIRIKPKKENPDPIVTVAAAQEIIDVIGKTTVVYLEDPELATKVPVHSQKLELSDFIGEEPDVPDDDVESELSPAPKTPEDLLEELERFEVMDDLAPGLDPDFSTGLTYDEMANAVSVLTVVTDEETQVIEAAKTIHRIKETDLFEFIINQVSNLDNVERLMNDCLDDNGTPLLIRKSKWNVNDIDSFDLSDYV